MERPEAWEADTLAKLETMRVSVYTIAHFILSVNGRDVDITLVCPILTAFHARRPTSSNEASSSSKLSPIRYVLVTQRW